MSDRITVERRVDTVVIRQGDSVVQVGEFDVSDLVQALLTVASSKFRMTDDGRRIRQEVLTFHDGGWPVNYQKTITTIGEVDR